MHFKAKSMLKKLKIEIYQRLLPSLHKIWKRQIVSNMPMLNLFWDNYSKLEFTRSFLLKLIKIAYCLIVWLLLFNC